MTFSSGFLAAAPAGDAATEKLLKSLGVPPVKSWYPMRQPVELLGEREPVLPAKVDVDQRYVGVQAFVIPKRLSAISRLTDNADSRALEHGAHGVAKLGAVVNDQTAHIAAR